MSAHHSIPLESLGVPVSRLVSDSRRVRDGDTFVAYPGSQTDGRNFIPQAIANGANAVLWEAERFSWNDAWSCPNLAVTSLREKSGYLANQVYGAPSQQLAVIGITGTNGKTSCSQWLANALTQLHEKTAVIGTLGNGFLPTLQTSANTTPEALTVHGLLADFLQQGAKNVAMEVSSHALVEGRVNGVHFDTALFTNLTRDHLDFHGDMNNYAQAKQSLFQQEKLRVAVLNLDDPISTEWIKSIKNHSVIKVGYGLTEHARLRAHQQNIQAVFAEINAMDGNGMQLAIDSSWGNITLHSPLLGRFNASNLLGCLAVLLAKNQTLADAVAALSTQVAVAGRMQTLHSEGKPHVVIDFAHTPDALEKVLQTLREITPASGRLICVFGCGGDRDRGKRPLMGQVVSRLADVCMVTSDNPRSEPPQQIADEITQGMTGTPEVVLDRAAAICLSIAQAQSHDTILLAGKGHEAYQEIAGRRHPFSDLDWASRALAAWPNSLQGVTVQ